MDWLEGHVVTDALPPGLESREARRALAHDLVDTLAEVHAADVSTPELADFARPGSYNERQARRFSQLWEIHRTREIQTVDEVGAWLADNLPDPLPATVVHGDYRLGNMMVDSADPRRIVAVLDWEMGAIGDPRADVGYLLATYAEHDGPANPLGTSPVTAEPGFPTKAELVERYVERSGRDVEPLHWFEALALWKAAVFCEAIYGRYVRGELRRRTTARRDSSSGCRSWRRAPPTRSRARSPRERLGRRFRESAQRPDVARRGEQRRRARLAPGRQAVADPVDASHERDLVDERVGDGRGGVAAAPVEKRVLDRARLRLVAVAHHQVVVEVLPACAHAAHVEGVVLLERVASRSQTRR